MNGRISRYTALFCSIILLISTGGVWATWNYAIPSLDATFADIPVSMNEFFYAPDMPEKEVTLLERFYDILNNEYSNDLIPEGESKQYLFDTMNKDWGTGVNPIYGSFVGSMDPSTESKERIQTMFQGIDFSGSEHVSFILKSEDLVGDVADEISIYTTSDKLTWSPSNWTTTVVGVYLSVFIPVRDEEQNIIRYELLCEALHGYCLEVGYLNDDNTPSFSTDHWRDELFYWHEDYATLQPIKGEDRYKYECYHPSDGYYAYPGRTINWMGWIEVETDQWNETETAKGKKAGQKLAEILAAQ